VFWKTILWLKYNIVSMKDQHGVLLSNEEDILER